MIRVQKGLDLPITGAPVQKITPGNEVQSVALLGEDYVGMKPTMEVQQGEQVKTGQLLFTDKKNPRVRYTSPGCGVVESVNRGAKRAFLSVVISLKGNEEETFASYGADQLLALDREKVVENLLNSGLWTSFKTRPLNKVANPDKTPHAIFVNTLDTNPLAANPEVILSEVMDEFVHGVEVVSRLTDGKVYVCHSENTSIPLDKMEYIIPYAFVGPHPSGLVGTHIHFIDPVHRDKTSWHLNYQDVVAIGHLFLKGKLRLDRVVSLAGSQVKEPRLVRTRLGANISDLVKGELKEGCSRRISGSVLCGRMAEGPTDYLGKYHLQISALEEGNKREFFGWITPGLDKFSVKNIFASKLAFGKKFSFSTSTGGSPRAMVPVGMYETVMPLDMIPTFLLRALAVGDIEEAEALGCMELDEEDLALCTFVCPGKYDFGLLLRESLARIEKEG